MNRSFASLHDAYGYARGLVNAGVPMEASRVYMDQLRPHKGDKILMTLGVHRQANLVCNRLAPGGTWGVEVEMPGTEYVRAHIFGSSTVKTTHHRCSAWYSKYLPYAYAMMKAEDSFRCKGIDFESINAYYGTCMGFVWLGHGDGQVDAPGRAWDRIEPADVSLFVELYNASTSILPPGLPFDEAFKPALCYVAATRPDLLARHCDKDNWQWTHACEVLEALGRPRPAYKKKPPRECSE